MLHGSEGISVTGLTWEQISLFSLLQNNDFYSIWNSYAEMAPVLHSESGSQVQAY